MLSPPNIGVSQSVVHCPHTSEWSRVFIENAQTDLRPTANKSLRWAWELAFVRIPSMILNVQWNWKTTFSYMNKPQSIFKYKHLLLSTANTSPPWTTCTSFVHKLSNIFINSLIFSHSYVFEHVMPFICPSCIFPILWESTQMLPPT